MIDSLFLPLIGAVSLLSAQAAPSAPAPTAKPPSLVKLTAENRAALRCSAAFALVSSRTGQKNSDQVELRTRGREFFVVTLAGIMDEHQLDRAAIEREVRAEAEKLTRSGETDQIMPACLLMLETAGL